MIIIKNPHYEVRSNFDVMLTDVIFEVAEIQTADLAEASAEKMIEYRTIAITEALISTWLAFSFIGDDDLLLNIGCSTPSVHRFMPQSSKNTS